MNSHAHTHSRSVGILAPTGKDASLVSTSLKNAGIDALVCPDVAAVQAFIESGAGILLLAEEALPDSGVRSLAKVLAQQPAWSDLPILLMTLYGADSFTVARVLQDLGNVTLLERPVRPSTLLSAVRTALKARERQYQVRAEFEERLLIEEALREADRRKNVFLATLAHELRNPLAPIRNSLHILRLSSLSDPAVKRVCEMMERQVSHLVRLVDDLMEVSRITRGKVELKKECVGLAALMRNAVEACQPQIDAAGHHLTISLPPEPLVINGDLVRLSQVFSNLLNNATKYMDEGGQIVFAARRDGNDVLISVRDTGIGIAPQMLPRIFTMFTQVEDTARKAQGGLGIGLTLVRSLVELHGGRVDAYSAGLGQGSEFVVRLPLQVEAPASATPSLSSKPVIAGHRVLVVDDNHDSAESIGFLIQLLGLEVRVANDGPTALEIFSEFHPTVVLLDIGMPKMDGYEVARQMRKQLAGREALLVALTGWGQEEDRIRTRKAGFDQHLVKPADFDMLQALFV